MIAVLVPIEDSLVAGSVDDDIETVFFREGGGFCSQPADFFVCQKEGVVHHARRGVIVEALDAVFGEQSPVFRIGGTCRVQAAEVFDPVGDAGSVVAGSHVLVEEVVDLVGDRLCVQAHGFGTRAAGPPAPVAGIHADHEADALAVIPDAVAVEIVEIRRIDRAGEPVG